MATGFIAIGSGPAGLSAAETFRSKHPHIPVRILSTDPALPYAKPPLSKAYLAGRDAQLDLHSAGWFIRHDVELQRGITVDHIDLAHQEVVTEGGRRYPYRHLVLACGANAVPLHVPGAEAVGLKTQDGRIVVEHWRDAAQQGLVAGLSAAGHAAVWDKVPEFSCTIGDSTLKYCGWGAGYDHSRLVEHRDGFTVWYESGGEVVGVLSLNADDDYRLACRLVRSHTSMTI